MELQGIPAVGTYLEHPAEVEQCILHFESLRDTALDPDRSVALIREIETGLAT